MGPSEKRASKLACGERRDTFSSPVCEQDSRNRGHFERSCGDWSPVSLRSAVRGRRGRDSHLRCRSEWRKRRRSRKLQGFNLLPGDRGTDGVAALCPTSAVSSPIERRMVGDSVAESGFYDASQAAKLVRYVVARLSCSPKARNISAGRARQKGRGDRRSPWRHGASYRDRVRMLPRPRNVEKFSGLRRAGCAICGWRETRCS